MRFTFTAALAATCAFAVDTAPDADVTWLYFGLGFYYGMSNYTPQLE